MIGVVTSVPSDSPDDFTALNDLKTKAGLRDKYGITLEMCNFDPIPIIDIPNFSNLSAVHVVNEMGIKSQNDKELLVEAKDICYKRGFYEGLFFRFVQHDVLININNIGVMLEGEFAGQTVQEAKKLVKNYLMEKVNIKF
jgi:leucyl-tRNA synthetase